MSEVGESIRRGMEDALAFGRGDKSRAREWRVAPPETVDVKKIRKSSGMTQVAFAARFGFKVATLRDWEQKRRTPKGPARLLLLVIEREPEAVERALKGAWGRAERLPQAASVPAR